MRLYMTNGTVGYLKSIKEKNPNLQLVMMQSGFSALLLHETDEKRSIFKQPRRYEIIDSTGEIGESGFVAIHHIPVTNEGRPIFEYRFKNRSWQVEKQTGFIAIRILRPVRHDTYVILTVWETEHDFNVWSQTDAYKNIYPKEMNYQQVFSASPYTMRYTIGAKDEEDDAEASEDNEY